MAADRVGGSVPTFRERVERGDVRAVRALTRAAGLFSEEEIFLAGQLVAEALADRKSGYRFLFAEAEGVLVGYTCYGRVPCTVASWDLYWIAVRRSWQGRGLGKLLIAETESRIVEAGGRQVWVETSARSDYLATRAFYRRAGYRKAAILEDFYAPGDHKVIFVKHLHGE